MGLLERHMELTLGMGEASGFLQQEAPMNKSSPDRLGSGGSSFAFNSPTKDHSMAGSLNRMGRSASESMGMELLAEPSDEVKPRLASAAKKGVSWPGNGTPSRSGAPVPIPDRLDLDLDLGSDSLLASVNAQLDQVAARLGLLGEGDACQAAAPSRPRIISSPAVMAMPHQHEESETSLSIHSAVMASSRKHRAVSSSIGGKDIASHQEAFPQQRHQPWASHSLVDLERMLHGPLGIPAGLNTDPRMAKRKEFYEGPLHFLHVEILIPAIIMLFYTTPSFLFISLARSGRWWAI